MRRAVSVWGFGTAPMLLESMVLVSVFLTSACVVESNGEGGAAGSSKPADELSCSGIFDCATDCAEGDTACADKCLAKGSDAAVEAVYGVVLCVDASACQDDECLVADCEAELLACIATSPAHAPDEPLPPDVPNGSVPGDLVGQWRGFEESYAFRADGTVSRDLHINSSLCSSDALEHGNAVADGATLTLYFLQGEITTCGEAEPYQPYSEVFSYEIKDAGKVLVLTGGNCTANCVNGFDKQ